jgi:hypothetical protein
VAEAIVARAREFGSAAKPIQIEPNKAKQICLDLFGFVCPNQDLSMGYERKKYEKFLFPSARRSGPSTTGDNRGRVRPLAMV